MLLWWIAALNFYVSFVNGALLPITPKLNFENAGFGFALFAVFKIVFFIPAGLAVDRFGARRSLQMTLLIQLAALAVLLWFPQWIWLSRGFEGVTLALGFLGVMSLCRESVSSLKEFDHSLQKILAAGGMGFILGPLVGYSASTTVVLVLLSASAVALLMWGAAMPKTAAANAGGVVSNWSYAVAASASSDRVSKPERRRALVALTFSKGLNAGFLPLIAWWADGVLGLRPLYAGALFISAGLGFVFGNLWDDRRHLILGTAAIGVLTAAMSDAAGIGEVFTLLLWSGSLLLLGGFFGFSVKRSLAVLGWNDPDSLGLANAKWNMITDSMMAVAPILFWNVLRDHGVVTSLLAVLLTQLAIACLVWGLRRELN